MEEFIKSIVIYVVIGSVLKGLVASPKYSRIFQFVSGMVLLLLMLSPLVSMLRQETDWYGSLEEKLFQMDLSQMEDTLAIADDAYEKVVKQEYQEAVRVQVEAMAGQKDLAVKSVEVTLGEDEDGNVVLAEISVQTEGAQTEAGDALCSQICDAFFVGEDQVHLWK